MRVGVVIHDLGGGGAQQVARMWCQVLVSMGHVVFVYTLDVSVQPTEVSLWARKHGISIRGLASRPPGLRGISIAARALRGARRTDELDAYLSLLTYPNIATIMANLNHDDVRVVISEHNVPSIYLPSLGMAHKVQVLIARRLYRHATKIIAVSHSVLTDLLINYSVRREQVVVIPNGILTEGDWHRAPMVVEDTLDSIMILVPARRKAQKRPAKAVSVAVEVARMGYSVELLFVGEGDIKVDDPHVPGLTIDTLAWRPDWHTLGAGRRRVVLLTSFVEGLANVLIEAAAYGIPVAAGSTALGVADAVLPGITGYLSEDDSDVSFAQAVVLSAAIDLSVESGVSRWLAQFTPEETQRRFNALFAE